MVGQRGRGYRMGVSKVINISLTKVIFVSGMQVNRSEYEFLENPQQLHRAISLCIEQILRDTQQMKEVATKFQMKNKPTITISQYLARIFKYMGCSPVVFVYALILIDRIQEYHDDFYMTSRNVHRLMITGVLVGTKYFDDFYFKNTYYAKLGGVATELLNQMEIEFLQLLNFNCHVHDLTLKSYLERLEFFAQLNLPNAH